DRHFGHFVLEALEGLERAFVNDDVVANKTNACTTLHPAFGDAATRDLADLGDVEHLKDLGVTDERLATLWRQQTGHGLLNVVDEIVDDGVVAHLDADVVSRRARLLVGTNVEADDHGTRSLGERDVAFRDGTCASMYDTRLHLVGAELVERCHDSFDRTLHVALDNQRELLEAAG